MTTLTNHSAIPTLGESRTAKAARLTAAALQALVDDDSHQVLANLLLDKKLSAIDVSIGSDLKMSEALTIVALDVDRLVAAALSSGNSWVAKVTLAAAADLRSQAEIYRSQGN